MSAEIVELAGTGRAERTLPTAFERLFVNEYARVVRIARRALGDRAEAEDVAQDAFLSFYRSHPADAPYAARWLHAAAVHTALNAVRARKRRTAREQKAAADPRDAAVDPEDVALATEERSRVRATLARLPARSAAALVLRHSGLSYAEVAAALEIRADHVGTLLRRAQDAYKKEALRDDTDR